MPKKSMITCPKCGAQILLVPDLKEMSAALDAHVNEHKKQGKVSEDEAEVVLEALITQALDKAADQA